MWESSHIWRIVSCQFYKKSTLVCIVNVDAYAYVGSDHNSQGHNLKISSKNMKRKTSMYLHLVMKLCLRNGKILKITSLTLKAQKDGLTHLLKR